MQCVTLLFAIGITIASSLSAMAQQDQKIENQLVYTAISPSTLEGVFRQAGIQFTRDQKIAQPGWTGYKLELLTKRVAATLSSDGSKIEVGIWWKSSRSSPNLETVNRWNEKIGFGRVHIDRDGDYWMKAMFWLEGGVRLQSIRHFVETFSVVMIHFEAFGISSGL
jgi:hypothetical protein